MNDYFSFVFEGINKILAQHASFFESMGMDLFRSFALINVCWFGVNAALSSAEGGPGFNWSRFAKVTDDKFFIVIETRDPLFSDTKAKALLAEIGGKHVTEVFDHD